jgi:hypothetical protein
LGQQGGLCCHSKLVRIFGFLPLADFKIWLVKSNKLDYRDQQKLSEIQVVPVVNITIEKKTVK